MALGASWARGKGPRTFARQFSLHLLGLATWLPVVIWFNKSVAEVTAIEGASMSPFLNSHPDETLRRDWVLNYKLGAQQKLERGMIVFLRWVPIRQLEVLTVCRPADRDRVSAAGARSIPAW